ncbi:MAG: type II toxin-antitoxin system RelE/ParE family toxin [Candidatus Sulfotelmatobacter sp.]
MAWTIDYTETAKKQLKKLDKPAARRILAFLDDRVAKQEDPRALGKALTGPLGTLWRYRIGDYRAICEIQHKVVTVLVIRIGHRREVYR